MDKNDPMFFGQLLITEKAYKDGVGQMLDEIGASPAIKYAHRKTGLILTQANKNLIPENDLREWKRAIKEFHSKKTKRKSKLESSVQKILIEYENILLLHALIVYRHNSEKEQINLTEETNVKDFVLFCTTKNIKTLKSFISLLQNDLYEDAFILTRSMYENYLSIEYMKNNHDDYIKILKAKVGLATKKYRYKNTKDGGLNRQIAIDNSTGEEIKIAVTSFKMASSTGLELDKILFDYLYDFLSGFAHPDLISATYYVNQQGFSPLQNKGGFESIIFSCFVNVLYLDSLEKHKFLDPICAQDIRFTLGKILPALKYVVKQASLPSSFYERLYYNLLETKAIIIKSLYQTIDCTGADNFSPINLDLPIVLVKKLVFRNS